MSFWLSVAVAAAGPVLASRGVPLLDKLPETIYIAAGAIGLACSFAWLAFSLDEQKEPRSLFQRHLLFTDIDARRFHRVRVTNPSEAESAEGVCVALTKVERLTSGVYRELPLGSAPRPLRWAKQEEAPDGGWGPRDIPPGSYNEANVVTAGPGHVLFEWRQPYKADPVIAEQGTYRLTLTAA